MNGDRLLFLLKYEFRLWNRSPIGLPAFWKNLRFYALCGLVTYPALWALNGFQLPQIHFSAASPSDQAIWIAGSIVNYIFLWTLICLIFGDQQAAQKKFSVDWIFSSPQPSKIMFASAILYSILTSLIAINFLFLFLSLPLVFISHSFQLFIGIHLTITGWIIVIASLNAWSQYFHKQYGTNKSWQLFRKICIYIASGVGIFLLGLPYGMGGKVISAQQASAMYSQLTQQGQLFGSDSWVWIPGRTFFLDPLPCIGLILGGLGLLWLTIQTLHHSYLKILQPSIEAPKKLKTSIKPVKFQSKLTHLIIVREWRNFRLFLPHFILAIIIFSGLPCIFLIPYIIFNVSSGGLDDSLILGLMTGFWPAFIGGVWTCRVFEIEDSFILLSSAPVSLSFVGWCKRLAVLIPIWTASVPVILLTALTGRPWGWVIFFMFTAPLCQAVLYSWNTLPIPSCYAWEGMPYSGEMRLDSGRDPQVLLWCGLLSLGVWAVAPCLIFMGQTLWGLLALGLEVGLMAIAHRRIHQIGNIWTE